MSSRRAALEREAEHLHASFFRRPAPPAVLERYAAAHSMALPEPGERTRRLIDAVVERRLDVEAVELFLRWRRRDRALSRKVQILFYLVEVRKDYYADFINQRPGVARAVGALLAAVVRTAWKFVKGWRLVAGCERV